MADRTLSQLDAASDLTGGELVYGTQEGLPVKFSPLILRGNVISAADHGAIGDNDEDRAAANTTAFNDASDALEAQGGGVLFIPPGIYYVGKQDFAGQLGLNYAYRGYDIVSIHNCAKPVKVIAEGVTIIFVGGLKFGSFDPITGEVHNPPPGTFTNGNYSARIGRAFYFTSNLKVELIGPLAINGNITEMTIGGRWGDTGIQLSAVGVEAHNNGSFTARDIDSDYNGLDGIMTGHSTQTLALDPRPILLENFRARYNGRQGWSLIGGLQSTAINCDFSHTGKNGVVASNPGAGIDIENEGSGIRNVTLINVRCHDNTGAGVVSDNTNVDGVHAYGCKFIGTTNYAMWPKVKGWKLYNCTVVGAVINQYDPTNPEDAFQAYDTLFTQSTSYSPSGVVYNSLMDFVNAKHSKFTNCTFDPALRSSPSFTSQSLKYSTFTNCLFRLNNSSNNSTIRGIFIGRNRVIHNGTWTSTAIVNRGSLIINDVEQVRGTPVVDAAGGRSITTDEIGTTFTNEGATAVASFVLPAAAEGLEYGFYVQDNSGLAVSPQSGDTLRINATVAATFQSTTIGSSLRLLAINATEWVAIHSSGTWAAPAAGDYFANRYFPATYFPARYFG